MGVEEGTEEEDVGELSEVEVAAMDELDELAEEVAEDEDEDKDEDELVTDEVEVEWVVVEVE